MLSILGMGASLITTLLENSEVKLLKSKASTGTWELTVKPMVPVLFLVDRANAAESGCTFVLNSGSDYRKSDGYYALGSLGGMTRGDSEIIIPTSDKLVLSIAKMTSCILHVFQ